MDDADRQAKFATQTDEFYAAVGRFAVSFEHVCQALRTGITHLLERQGLANQAVAAILLVDLTARPLQSIFRAILAETVKMIDDERQIVKDVMKRCQELTEQRNNAIHNAWFIGWASPDQTDFSETSALKPFRCKQGGGLRVDRRTAEDFLELAEKAEQLTALVNRLWGCVAMNRAIGDNFRIDAEGHAHVPAS